MLVCLLQISRWVFFQSERTLCMLARLLSFISPYYQPSLTVSAKAIWRIGGRSYPHVLWLTPTSHIPFTRKGMQSCFLAGYLFMLCCVLKIGKTRPETSSTLSFLSFYSLLASICSAEVPYVVSQENILQFLWQSLHPFPFYSELTCWLENICHKGKTTLLDVKDQDTVRHWQSFCPKQPSR